MFRAMVPVSLSVCQSSPLGLTDGRFSQAAIPVPGCASLPTLGVERLAVLQPACCQTCCDRVYSVLQLAVPGSHRSTADQLFAARLMWPDAIDPMPGSFPIAATAGTAIVMNSNIWHASQPNNSTSSRTTVSSFSRAHLMYPHSQRSLLQVHLYYTRPWVKPVGLTRDGSAYIPRLLACAKTATRAPCSR